MGLARQAAMVALAVLPVGGHMHLGGPPGFVGYAGWWTQNLDEVEVESEVEVQGEIPAWLSGSLVRNGPGMFEKGGERLHHQFDGLAKLSKFALRDGKAFFQTRFLRSELYNNTMKDAVFPPHMTMLPVTPEYSELQKIEALKMSGSVNPNIFVWKTGDVHFATQDQTDELRFDLKSLSVEGYMKYEGDTSGMFTGAHKLPAYAKEGGGETIGWHGTPTMIPMMGLGIQVYRDTPDLKRHFIGYATVPYLALIHSIAVTENYVIVMVPNVGIDMAGFAKGMAPWVEFSMIKALQWHGDKNAQILVFDVHSTDPHKKPVRTFETTPMYMNHHINAYEDEAGDIHMDLVGYEDGAFLQDPHGFANLDVMVNYTARHKLSALDMQLRRYQLNMSSQLFAESKSGVPWSDFEHVHATVDPLSGEGHKYLMEMPRFNERMNRGKPYCFIYGMSVDQDDHPNIIKVDFCKGGKTTVWGEANKFPSEPIFVPRPGATSEDDGVVLAVALDGAKGASCLVVLDAATMQPLAKAYVSVIAPYDVHGQFFPDEDMYTRIAEQQTMLV